MKGQAQTLPGGGTREKGNVHGGLPCRDVVVNLPPPMRNWKEGKHYNEGHASRH